MKSWLREAYQAVMNGALWLVFIAALSTSKWPTFDWVTGSLTAVLVVIVAVVYWIAVVTNDDIQPDSTTQRENAALPDTSEAQPIHESSARSQLDEIMRREEIVRREALAKYLSDVNSSLKHCKHSAEKTWLPY